jgi:hypothetical protein
MPGRARALTGILILTRGDSSKDSATSARSALKTRLRVLHFVRMLGAVVAEHAETIQTRSTWSTLRISRDTHTPRTQRFPRWTSVSAASVASAPRPVGSLVGRGFLRHESKETAWIIDHYLPNRLVFHAGMTQFRNEVGENRREP